MINLKNKLTNTKFNFSKNIITSLVVPALCVVLAVVLAIMVGFNKTTELNGGIMLSVASESANLTVQLIPCAGIFCMFWVLTLLFPISPALLEDYYSSHREGH